jgi:hypothetical protein
MLWNVQFVKLINKLGLSCLAMSLLIVSASAQTPVKVKVNIKNGSLLVDTYTRAAKPSLRMNPDPAYLELTFPNAVLDGDPETQPIDKGLIQKVVTAQSQNDAVVRVYVLSKPKTKLSKTDTGYRYDLNLNVMASSQPSTTTKPTSEPDDKPPSQPVADSKPTTKPVEDKPVATKPVATKPVETKPIATKPVETTKPEVAKPATTEPVATKPADIQPTRTVAPPATDSSATIVREYFPFKTKSAEKAMTAAQLAFPNVTYLVDPVLNVLMVEGTPTDIQQLEKYLRAQSPK